MRNHHKNRRQIYKIHDKDLKSLVYKELLHVEKKKTAQ